MSAGPVNEARDGAEADRAHCIVGNLRRHDLRGCGYPPARGEHAEQAAQQWQET
jgi:hypothetical protein